MVYDLMEVRRLLLYSYQELEELHQAAHRDPVVRCAVRIKAFMSRKGIATVREGIRQYAASRSASMLGSVRAKRSKRL